MGLKHILQVECPALCEQFHALPWAAHPLIQSTLLYAALHVVEGEVSVRRETIPSGDGGTLALDWMEREGAPPSGNGAPILLHFPGLSNCMPTIGFGAMVVGAMQEHCLHYNLPARAASVIYPGFAGHTLDSHKLPGLAQKCCKPAPRKERA
ncbi:hypothetical protein T492DRAFT_976990 [Pavlovales sp. CCMP2436]|nr:hypothetical protein T492DRAFT_976990 [Pavlovales sp. CCMP2436]